MDNRIAWKIQVDTYEREVERYGGVQGMALCESAFAADSNCAIRILSAPGLLTNPAGRWQAALLGTHTMLNDFGVPLDMRIQWCVASRDNQMISANLIRDGELLPEGAVVVHQLGQAFRTDRPTVEALLDDNLGAPSLPGMEPVRAAFADRSTSFRQIAAELNALWSAHELGRHPREICGSLVHMSVNRLCRANHRSIECRIHDSLARYYRGVQARSQAGMTHA